jgi:hypothetical protein
MDYGTDRVDLVCLEPARGLEAIPSSVPTAEQNPCLLPHQHALLVCLLLPQLVEAIAHDGSNNAKDCYASGSSAWQATLNTD